MTCRTQAKPISGPDDFFAEPHGASSNCANPDCDMFPQYGVAPHECYWRKPGGFEANPLGTSTIINFEVWPDNFLAEITDDKPVANQIGWGLCGIYYCPLCLSGKQETSTLWGVERIRTALEQQP